MRLFLLYMFIETIVSVEFASVLGGFMTFAELIISAAIGIGILKNLNMNIRENLYKVRAGEITQEDFTKMQITSLIGAILLIIPGFFTDIIGIILQFDSLALPFIRKFVRPKNTVQFDNYSSANEFKTTYYSIKKDKKNEEIIDVEVIE